MSDLLHYLQKNPKKIVFAEADNYKILKAVQQVNDEGIALPVLLGDPVRIKNLLMNTVLISMIFPVIMIRPARKKKTE